MSYDMEALSDARKRHRLIPRDLEENLEYRRDVLLKCEEGCSEHSAEEWRAAIWQACKEDILYFVNAFCIAAGTLVVTSRGLVPIEEVTNSDHVWDGESWVENDGALCMGKKEVIMAYGLSITPDHKVMSENGWQRADKRCKRKEVRLPDGYWKDWGQDDFSLRLRREESRRVVRCSEDCKEGRKSLLLNNVPLPRKESKKTWSSWHKRISDLGRHGKSLHKQAKSTVRRLRRTWNNGLRAMDVFFGILERHGRFVPELTYHRASGQLQGIQQSELCLGNAQGASQQQKEQRLCRNRPGSDANHRGSEDRWNNKGVNEGQDKTRLDQGSPAVAQVYDLINCGPRQAFTVIGDDGRPLLVHNCFCYEPRDRFITLDNGKEIELPSIIPFISWEHQDPVISEIYDCLGKRDCGVEKSRGEGLSWILVLLAAHDFIFHDFSAVGLVSKDEVSVDDPANPDSLFWKIDKTLEWLPDWLSGRPGKDYKRDVTKHTILNHRNGSTISGYAATANVSRGGRKRFFGMDELAAFPRGPDKDAMSSTQHVTECRIIISTPQGSDGEYYDAMHRATNMARIIVDWKNNPVRNRGLYQWADGKAVALDPINNPIPPEYDPPNADIIDMMSRLRRAGYKIEGTTRSAWFDRECDRVGATPTSIAQELERDYGGSAHRVFPHSFFTKCENCIENPLHEGDLDFQTEKISQIRFDAIDGGPLKLWVPLSSTGQPPAGRFVFGADISGGTGGSFTSNSVLCGMNMQEKDQVLEFALNTIPPDKFADFCIAVCKWFGNAFLAWEINGPGSAFTKQILYRQYANIYYRKQLFRLGGKPGREPGWNTDKNTQDVLFTDFSSAVIGNQFFPRSIDLKLECGRWVRKGGKIENALVKNAPEDSQGVTHGDRTIAAAVMIQAAKERPMQDDAGEMEDLEIPYGSMAWREREHRRSLQERRDNDIFGDGLDEFDELDLIDHAF